MLFRILLISVWLTLNGIAISRAEPFQETNTSIEEIIVTASKRSQTQASLPFSLSVIDDSDLDRLSIYQLSDLSSRIPGLHVVDTGARNTQPVTIRGLSVDTLNANDRGSNGGNTAIYLDAIPLPVNSFPLDVTLYDIEQVEVLRGPQGTLYGAHSLAGVVRYLSAKPDTDRQQGQLSAGVSQTRHSEDLSSSAQFVINQPLQHHHSAIRLSGRYEDEAGFVDNALFNEGAKKDINQAITQDFRVSGLWQENTEQSALLRYYYQSVDVDDRQADNIPYTGEAYEATHRIDQPMSRDTHMGSLEWTQQFEGFYVKSQTTAYDLNQDDQFDQTDLLITLDCPDCEQIPGFLGVANNAFEVTHYAQEIQWVSSSASQLTWLLGVYIANETALVDAKETTPGLSSILEDPSIADLLFEAYQTSAVQDRAVFGEWTQSLAPHWDTTLGMRYFTVKERGEFCLTQPLDTSTVLTDCRHNTDKHEDFIGKWSLQYQHPSHGHAYLTVSEGFRRGGANILPKSIDRDFQSYKPDTSLNTELGYRQHFFNGRLSLATAIYHIDWQDIQVAASSPSGFGITTNGGDAQAQGVELSLITALNTQLSVDIQYAYNETTLTDDAPLLDAQKDDSLPGSPRNQGAITLLYDQTVTQGTLRWSVTGVYTGQVSTTLGPQKQTLDSYHIVNASLAWAQAQWEISLFVKNLTNERAVTGRRSTANYGARGQFDYINRPLTTGMRLVVNF